MPACARCGESNGSDATFCRRCGTRLVPEPGTTSARKVVTVLFSDVSGFTALGERLDPESLQQLMSRWFNETKRIIERHSGTVEKYMGDAVMAVFGVPVVHEDDAARAARAALELGETLIALNDELRRRWGVELEIHTGLNTGEVVVGSAPGGDLSTVGDAVNVAQRLEASAPPGEVLIGDETARHLGDIAEVEEVDPLSLKGKSLPVAAWRLVSGASGGAEAPTRSAPPFVGRERELDRLREVFDFAVASRQPRLVTVIGPAGIGKSRLVQTLLDEAGGMATTAVGRCLPYGDGITYWPLAEIVRSLAGAPSEEAVARLIDGAASNGDAGLIAAQVSRATGFARGAVSGEEAQWAVRTLIERVAEDRPLVVAVEDIHWAEPVMLDLLEHVATVATAVPLLVVCLARPELLDARPAWDAVGGARSEIVVLEPLRADSAEELIDGLIAGSELSPADRTQLLTTAEGNPFFLEQMVAMRLEAGEDAGTAVPPTVQAVVTARIDRLPPLERSVIERASTEGRIFHRGAVAESLEERDRGDLDWSLDSLLRRGLIRTAASEFANERAYGFDHILIRDAAYSLIPKRVRADLHERHAAWLERRSDQELGEHHELAGYHLERAFRCRVALEPAAVESHGELATRAAVHLGAAGRAALARDDIPAAIKLLSRAVELLPEDTPWLDTLSSELGGALTEAGQLAEAEAVLDTAATRAAARGDAVAEGHALVRRLFVRLQVDTGPAAREARERFDSLLATFEGAGDDLGLGRLWGLRALVHWIEARSASADAAWERAAHHARKAGDVRGWSDALSWLASSAYTGPVHVDKAIARCETIRAELGGHRRAQALVLEHLAAIRAMRGELVVARGLIADSRALLAELGVSMHTAVSHDAALVALASGDAQGAEAALRAGHERLAEMGEKALLADTAAMLARVLYEQGRFEEAMELTGEAQDAADPDDLSVRIGWRTVRARLLARGGDVLQAKSISAEAVDLAARTDWLSDHAEALLAHGEVLRMAGETEEAARMMREAISLYERKGNEVGARRGRALLAVGVPA
jgi:class 3 adenylate cyclase/tetratricopeptide (TPR) repeat protein